MKESILLKINPYPKKLQHKQLHSQMKVILFYFILYVFKLKSNIIQEAIGKYESKNF